MTRPLPATSLTLKLRTIGRRSIDAASSPLVRIAPLAGWARMERPARLRWAIPEMRRGQAAMPVQAPACASLARRFNAHEVTRCACRGLLTLTPRTDMQVPFPPSSGRLAGLEESVMLHPIPFVCAGLTAGASAQCESLLDLIDFGDEEEFAAYGSEVAIDAGATVAMIAGVGFDLGDGIVRVLEREDGGWVEVDPIEPSPDQWGSFGHNIEFSADGNTAVIASPFASEPLFNSGAVSVYERDPDAGEWILTELLEDPSPGVNYNFGGAATISADGNTIVISRVNVLGSEFVPLPDAVYVSTREGDAWTAPAPIPTDGVENDDQFGFGLDVADDGTRLAVGAPHDVSVPDRMPYVRVYDLIDGQWTHTATLEEPAKGFTSFGVEVALADQQLIASDGFKSTVFVYELIDGEWAGLEMIQVPEDLDEGGFGGALDVQGEHMLIGAPQLHGDVVQFSGGVFQYKRGGDGRWKVVSLSQSPMPSQFGGYGRAIAIDATGEQWVIGAPMEETQPEGAGRAYVVDSVVSGTSFDADENASPGVVTVTFPGGEPQAVPVSLIGPLLALLAGCEDVESLSLAGSSLTTVEETIEVQLPDGTPVIFSDALITVEEPSNAALLEDGQGVLTGSTLRLAGQVKIGRLPPFEFSDTDVVEPITVALSGGDGEPLSMSLSDVSHTIFVDLGLGENNPTIHLEASVEAVAPAGCDADCNADGELNVLDFVCFQLAWVDQEPLADCDANGVYNVLDFVCFQLLFVEGCD